MSQIVYSKGFLKSVKAIPKECQRKLSKLLEIFQEQPFHSLLHTKHLSGELSGFLSFRITRDWRVIFRFESPEVIKLIRVANRKDIYR